jgi:Holliday junction resolvase
VDQTQAEIVGLLRGFGFSVQSLSGVGDGCPDLLCADPYTNRTHLIEVKNTRGRGMALTPDQVRFHGAWRGAIHVLASAEQCERWVRTIRKGGRDAE